MGVNTPGMIFTMCVNTIGYIYTYNLLVSDRLSKYLGNLYLIHQGSEELANHPEYPDYA